MNTCSHCGHTSDEAFRFCPACGTKVAEVEANTERDRFMSAEEALDYGIIDRVMERHSPNGQAGQAQGGRA